MQLDDKCEDQLALLNKDQHYNNPNLALVKIVYVLGNGNITLARDPRLTYLHVC